MNLRKNFLPVCAEDLNERGLKELDIILVTGDAYVDHPSYGAAVIGRVLEDAGFKTGIISQPDWRKKDDFMKLGRPRLFFGVTAGNLDSTLSNYTLQRNPRRKDAYSPGGKTGLRPNRATIVYSNRLRECFPGVPVVLGGVEASLSRLAHYFYWSGDVRRSILLDAKADILVYGMGENAVTEIAKRLSAGENIASFDDIRGTVIARSSPAGFKNYVEIPSFEEASADPDLFNEAFRKAYFESDPLRGKTVIQKHGNRFVIQLPPPEPLTAAGLDRIYALAYCRRWHPDYDSLDGVPGFEAVRFSVTSHRGCAGECSFCGLYAHQGRIVQSRSAGSILNEVGLLAKDPLFRGTITDIGGPTANLYDSSCDRWRDSGACRDKNCLMPSKCPSLRLGYEKTVQLWKDVLKIPGVKHLFISSGLRYDLLVEPYADEYLMALCEKHVSGLLKVAPEHKDPKVLRLMNKPPFEVYERFREKFSAVNRRLRKEQYLVHYLICSHPGTGLEEALHLALDFAGRGVQPEQIQDFIPLPMTVSGCMYHTGKHPLTGEKVFVPRGLKEKRMQRALVQSRQPKNRGLVREALRELNRPDLEKNFLKASGGRKTGTLRRGRPEDLREAGPGS